MPVRRGTLGSPIHIEAQLLVAVYPSVASSRGPSHVERISIDQRGIVKRTTVLDAAALVPGAYLNSWRNVHHPAGGSGGEVVVALCHNGQCGGHGAADAEAKTTLVRTRNNGLTWELLATLDGAFWITSWRAGPTEVILNRVPVVGESAQRAPEFVRWPLMQPVAPSHVGGRGDPWPVVLADGRIAEWAGSQLVDEAGTTVLDLAALGSVTHPVELSPSPDGRRLIVTWSRDQPTTGIGWHWTLFERLPNGTYDHRQTISQPDGVFIAVPYSWLDDHRVMIPAGVPSAALGLPADTRIGYVPAIVDFTTGEVRPLAAFADPAVVWRGNLVIGVD